MTSLSNNITANEAVESDNRSKKILNPRIVFIYSRLTKERKGSPINESFNNISLSVIIEDFSKRIREETSLAPRLDVLEASSKERSKLLRILCVNTFHEKMRLRRKKSIYQFVSEDIAKFIKIFVTVGKFKEEYDDVARTNVLRMSTKMSYLLGFLEGKLLELFLRL